MLAVILCFWGMLSYTEREMKKMKTAVRARSGREAQDDLALLHAALSRYADAHAGRLPSALGAEGALRSALSPEFVSSDEAFVNRRDGLEYPSNPRLAGGSWAEVSPAAYGGAQTPLAWEATFSESSARKWVLFADGSLREVDGDGWARLLPGLTPAPSATPTPSASPKPGVKKPAAPVKPPTSLPVG